MLIVFKSSASGDVIMLGKNGMQLLGLIDKDPNDAHGIVTVEQLPGAMASVKTAIKADNARHLEQVGNDEVGNSDDRVHLSRRALPLLDLMERSLKNNVPVTWDA
jgi:hypothetical protein